MHSVVLSALKENFLSLWSTFLTCTVLAGLVWMSYIEETLALIAPIRTPKVIGCKLASAALSFKWFLIAGLVHWCPNSGSFLGVNSKCQWGGCKHNKD
jgi:hypothetical protein